jgi:tRNA nucleotidyltransferase (CCA-adding enzyme)
MPTLVRDLMRPPVTLPEETAQMGAAEAELRISDVRHLLVVDGNGKLAGIVSRGDVMRALEREGHHPIRDYMTRRVYTARPDAHAVEALDLMVARGVGAVPVIDADERPVGILTEVDFLKKAREALS